MALKQNKFLLEENNFLKDKLFLGKKLSMGKETSSEKRNHLSVKKLPLGKTISWKRNSFLIEKLQYLSE
jgi:hypothetical protein